MKYAFLILMFITTAAKSNELSFDTLSSIFSGEIANEPSKQIAACDVIHTNLIGKSDEFMLKAVFLMSSEGGKKSLKSHGNMEYVIGYHYYKNFWDGWYSSIKVVSPEGVNKVMKMAYKKLQCAQFLK